MLITVVNENTYLLGADLLRSEAEYKEKRVDNVGLTASVRSYHRIEALLRMNVLVKILVKSSMFEMRNSLDGMVRVCSCHSKT